MLSILEVDYEDIKSFLIGNNIKVPEKKDFAYVTVLYHLYSQTYQFISDSLLDITEEIGCKKITKINYQSATQQKLNADIMLQLCGYLDPYSIVSLCETCKTALSITKEKNFWNILTPLLINNKFDITKLSENEILYYTKTYHGKRKQLSLVNKNIYIIKESSVYFIDPASNILDCPATNKGISHIIEGTHDNYIMVDGIVFIYVDQGMKMVRTVNISDKIIKISEYNNECLYSDYKGNSYIFENNKLRKIREMKNIKQKENNLFLTHNSELFVNKQLILNNVSQITINYALTTNGILYKIYEQLVTELNINLKGIKQITSNSDDKLFILTDNGLVYYYYDNKLIKDRNLEDVIEILVKDNKLFVLQENKLNIIDLFQNKIVNAYRYDDTSIWNLLDEQ